MTRETVLLEFVADNHVRKVMAPSDSLDLLRLILLYRFVLVPVLPGTDLIEIDLTVAEIPRLRSIPLAALSTHAASLVLGDIDTSNTCLSASAGARLLGAVYQSLLDVRG